MKSLLTIFCFIILFPSGISQQITPAWTEAIDINNFSEGLPFDVIGDIDGVSYVVLSDSKRNRDKHLAINSFDAQMKKLKSINLLKKYPKLVGLKLVEKKCGNGKVFLGFNNIKSQEKEAAYVLILNKDLTVFKGLKLVKETLFKKEKTAVKIASLHILINPKDLKFPICIVEEMNSIYGEGFSMTATQYDINLEEKKSIIGAAGLSFFSDKTLFTGKVKYYENFFELHYSEAGVFGYLASDEVFVTGNSTPFVQFNFSTNKFYSKMIPFGNKGKKSFYVKMNNRSLKLFYLVQEEPYTTLQSMNGVGVLVLGDELEIIQDKVSVFSGEQIKKAYGVERYQFEVKKGKRKLRTLRTIYSATSLHAMMRISDVLCSDQGDFITIAFSYYIAGKQIWTTKGSLVVKFEANQSVAWMKGIYSEFEGSQDDSKLAIKNDKLILAYNSNVDMEDEDIDKKIQGASFQVTTFDIKTGEVGNSSIFNSKPNSVSKQGISLFEADGSVYFFGTPKGRKKASFIALIK